MHQKLVPDLFLFLVNSPKQPLHGRNSFKNKVICKRIIKKPLTLFFLLNPVPFNGQDYEKGKGPRTSDQSLFRIQSKFRKIILLFMYYLMKSDDVL